MGDRRLVHGLTAFDGGRWVFDLVDAVVFLDQVAHALGLDLGGDDNIREEKLEVANLTVCRVDSLDMRHPARLRERLRGRSPTQRGAQPTTISTRWNSLTSV